MRAANVCLKGERVIIRPLRRDDLDLMSTWEPFEDPVDQLFDWPRRSAAENAFWFAELLRDNTRVYYAVEDERRTLIGRISLREIHGHYSARLGIGFGRDYVSQGYGTEALKAFLRYYFCELGFERMVLDVSAANRRAIACYERLGFRHVSSHFEYAGYDSELAFLKQEKYRDLRPFFSRREQSQWMLAYDMELGREEWLEHQTVDERCSAQS